MDMHRTRTLLVSAAAASVVGLVGLTGSAQATCPGTSLGDPDLPQCPPPAQTVKAVGKVVVAPGYTLGVRRVPRQNARQYRQLPNGGNVLIVCQTRGSLVKGTYGPTRVWNKLKNGGYVSDAFVYTGSNGRVAPNC